MYQEKIHPFGIVGQNLTNITFFIGIVMLENTNDGIITINEWDRTLKPSNYSVLFSDPSTEVKFALKPWNLETGDEERILQFGKMRHVSYEKIPYTKYLNNSPGLFEVRPSEIPNYYGLEAKVRNISKNVNPSQISLSVPLKITNGNGQQIQVQQIFVQLIPPKDYIIVSSMPQPNLYRLVENNSVAYEFEVDTRKTDLFVLFENMFISRTVQISQIILGMLLSLATYLMANGFLNIITPIKSKIIRTHQVSHDCAIDADQEETVSPSDLKDNDPDEVLLLKI